MGMPLDSLFHASDGGFDRVNIGAQVMAVGSGACPGRGLGTARPLCVAEPWIFADRVFEVADARRFGGRDGDVSFGKGSAPDDQVLIKLIWVKAGLQDGFRALT